MRFHPAGRYLLRNRQNVDGREVKVFAFARIDVRQGRIGSAEVDADLHAVTRSRTLNSSFQRRPSRATHHNWRMPVSVTTVSSDTGTRCANASVAGRFTSMGESSSRS